MQSIKLVLFMALVLTAFSCSKKDEYPRKYVRSEFLNGEVKMFTKGGKVADKQEIDEFVERVKKFALNSSNPPANVYSFDDASFMMHHYNIEITLTSDTEGIISIISNDYQPVNFNLIKKDDYYLISMSDTVVDYNYVENPKYKCSPEIVERIPLPMALDIVKYLMPIYIKVDDDEILICVVSYMERNYSIENNLIGQTISWPINNMINNDYLMFIQNPSYNLIDTLAFKESYIVFK
jgi:hypothetical protein